MTKRLYYTDAVLTSFDATVVSCTPAGDRFEAVLDETAFYPTSGGQPHDIGTLGPARVTDVVDRDDGVIVHVVDAPVQPGTRVAGLIEWTRRFDHMQQHTGQHVLSAAFDRLAGARTISFHMGADGATIDLAREMTPGEIGAAEAEANRIVWENRPVGVRFASAEEAAALPLRKESARTGELRLVDVADFDLSACGGTHVPATGAIGMIAVTGWERFKGGSRVSFVCGARAVRSHARLRDAVAAASRLLSAPAGEMTAAIERLQADARQAARTIELLEKELGTHRAAAMRAEAETIGGTRVVLRMLPGASAGTLKQLAAAIVEAPGLIAVLVGEGQPAPVAAARSADVTFDVGVWIKQAAQALGGRGGGRPDQAQGGIGASAEAILAFARAGMGDVKKTIQ
jgi:alanyl-tRNA synthetase